MKAKLFFLALVAVILCGCGPSYYTTSPNRFSIGKSSYISNYRVMQTINTHFALVVDNRIVASPLILAIRTSEGFDPFYDGEIVSGQFVMVDTYTYETVPDENGRTRVKTVPLVVPKDDYANRR